MNTLQLSDLLQINVIMVPYLIVYYVIDLLLAFVALNYNKNYYKIRPLLSKLQSIKLMLLKLLYLRPQFFKHLKFHLLHKIILPMFLKFNLNFNLKNRLKNIDPQIRDVHLQFLIKIILTPQIYALVLVVAKSIYAMLVHIKRQLVLLVVKWVIYMGVATPWPKGAMAPPIILEKIFFTLFCVFYVLSCHLFAFYKF